VEGEKDADNLGALGLTATTSPMGAGKWKPHYNRYLQGKKVAIIPDNDAAGRKHARAIAAGLVVVAEAVKIVDLPNLKPKGDISDWLANGGSKESLLERLQRTPLFTDASKVSEGEQDNQSQWSKPIFPLTDFGNGERFAAQNSENTRFCHTWGKWLLWSGKHWEIDETSRIYQLAKITVRNIYAEPHRSRTTSGEGIFQARQGLGIFGRLQAMLSLAQTEQAVAITGNALDSNPWLLNVLNGTVDLRTGVLHPHRARTSTKIALFIRSAAACPQWFNFL